MLSEVIETNTSNHAEVLGTHTAYHAEAMGKYAANHDEVMGTHTANHAEVMGALKVKVSNSWSNPVAHEQLVGFVVITMPSIVLKENQVLPL